jgi:hypothetical protein
LAGIVRDAKQTIVSEYLNSVHNLFAITVDPDISLLKSDDIAQLEQLFPQIKIERLSGCSHEFLSENPRDFVKFVEKL